jgi:HlyD family secretion protein
MLLVESGGRMADTELTMRDRVAMLRLPDAKANDRSQGRVTWLPWTLCLLLAFSTLSLFVRSLAMQPVAAPSQIIAAATSAEVKSQAPDKSPGASDKTVLESKGYIVAAHQIQVSPIEVSGRIVKLFAEEGKFFKEGEPLAILDSSSFEADYQESKAALEQTQARLLEMNNGSRPEEIDTATAELKEAEETLKQIKLELDRDKNMTNGAMSAQDLEKAQFSYTAQLQKVVRLEKILLLAKLGPRKERIEAASADVRTCEARVRRAKWRLDNCVIRAPVTGTVLKKSAEVGNLVSPLSFNVSASICEMADLSDLEVDLEVPERDISKVIKGMPATVTTDAYPDRIYRGTVDRLMPIALQNKAAIEVRVKVTVPREEVGVYLKPGMNSKVAFLQPESAKTNP